jgi:hypothetical protein
MAAVKVAALQRQRDDAMLRHNARKRQTYAADGEFLGFMGAKGSMEDRSQARNNLQTTHVYYRIG